MAYTRLKETKDGRRYYEIAVSRGRDQSRLTRRWYVPDGWSKKAIDRQLAKEAAEFERQVKDGEILTRKEKAAQKALRASEAAKVLTVGQFAESVFMPSKQATMTENSRTTYQSYLNNWILPAFGDDKLTEVRPAQISAFLLEMQQQGKSHSTVVKVYTILSGLFKMAFLQDAIQINPMLKVQRPKARKDEQASAGPETLTADEVKQLLRVLETEPLEWRTLVHVLLDTGVRRGECCAITWKNVDFKTGSILIDKSLNYTPAQGVYLASTKNGHSRTVYVGGKTLSLLKQLREDQAGRCVSQYVFTRRDSPEPIHPQSPTRYLKKLSQRTGLDLHPHKLRHTFASLAITNGGDVVSVSQVLGHSDTSVTLRVYAHASEDSARRAAAAFREAIGET